MSKMRTFRCDDNTWRKFKLVCTIEGIPMQTKLGDLVEEFVKISNKKLSSEIANGSSVKSQANI